MEKKDFENLTQKEKHDCFQKAFDNYNSGFIEEDYRLKSVESDLVEDAMDDSGRVLEEFKSGQIKVIFEAAKANVDLDYFMNPKFSVVHMEFILEQLKAGNDVTKLPVGDSQINIVKEPLTKKKIENIKKKIEIKKAKESVISNLKEKKKQGINIIRNYEKNKQGSER